MLIEHRLKKIEAKYSDKCGTGKPQIILLSENDPEFDEKYKKLKRIEEDSAGQLIVILSQI